MTDNWMDFASTHVLSIVEDGPDHRAVCLCGWVSLPAASLAEAERITCAVESEQNRGRGRLVAMLARRAAA